MKTGYAGNARKRNVGFKAHKRDTSEEAKGGVRLECEKSFGGLFECV
jgi:hypothetical protein